MPDEIDADCLILAKKYLKGSPYENDSEKEASLATEIEAAVAEWLDEHTD
jgi:hypothetical protein